LVIPLQARINFWG